MNLKTIAEQAAVSITDNPPPGPAEACDRLLPYFAQARSAALEEIARKCDKRIEERQHEYGIVEHDTNAFYYPDSHEGCYTTDEEAEAIAALARTLKEEGSNAAPATDEVREALQTLAARDAELAEVRTVVHRYLMDHAVAPRQLKTILTDPNCMCPDCLAARAALAAAKEGDTNA